MVMAFIVVQTELSLNVVDGREQVKGMVLGTTRRPSSFSAKNRMPHRNPTPALAPKTPSSINEKGKGLAISPSLRDHRIPLCEIQST